MGNRYWLLDGKKPIPTDDIMALGRLFMNPRRIVAKTKIGKVRISTVFLGVDHNFMPNGPPLLFETMIFGGKHDEYQTRCSTWEQAEAEHVRAIALVKGLNPPRKKIK